MPGYYCRGIKVQLSAWTHPACCASPSDVAKSLTEITDRRPEFEPAYQHPALHDVPSLDGEDLDPISTAGWKEENLKEEFYNEHRGLFFLDNETPSYLVHAYKPGVEPDNAMSYGTKSQNLTGISRGELLQGSPFSTVCLNRFEKTPSFPQSVFTNFDSYQPRYGPLVPRPLEFECNQPVQPPQTIFSDKVPSETENLKDETTDGYYFVQMPFRASRSIDPSPLVPEISSEPEAILKPLEVSINLSENSFRGIFQTSHDICINVFYNGELASSRVIKLSPLLASGWTQRVSFTGRRSEVGREIPWMIFTGAPIIREHGNPDCEMGTAISASQRWHELSELLRAEADQWGKLKNGSRSIVGNYLELLSKDAMPQVLDKNVRDGKEFGVIDVLIGYGRASSQGLLGLLASPSRRLPGRMRNSNTGEGSRVVVESVGNISSSLIAPIHVTTNSNMPNLPDISKEKNKLTPLHRIENPRTDLVPPEQSSHVKSKKIPQKRGHEPSSDPEEYEVMQKIEPKDVLTISTRNKSEARRATSLPAVERSIPQKALSPQQNMLPAATLLSSSEYWTSSILTQPTSKEKICDLGGIRELPDKEINALVYKGSPIIENDEPDSRALQKPKSKCHSKLMIAPREIRLMLESPFLNGIDICSGFTRGRTRRATLSLNNTIPKGVPTASLTATDRQTAKKVTATNTFGTEAAPSYTDASAAAAQTMQKNVQSKRRSKADTQCETEGPDLQDEISDLRSRSEAISIPEVEMSFAIGNDNVSSQGIKACSPLKTCKSESLCMSSVLTYPTSEYVAGFERDVITGQVYKAVAEEHDEYFETEGILMGTRFVVTAEK